VDTHDGNVRSMNGAAHVQTAGYRYSYMTGQRHIAEMTVNLIHDRFDGTRSIDCRSMAVNPSLRMDDIGDARAGSADGEFVAPAFQVIYQWLKLRFVSHQKFYIVSGCKSQVPITVFIGNLADFTDKIDTHYSGSTYSDSIEIIACL